MSDLAKVRLFNRRASSQAALAHLKAAGEAVSEKQLYLVQLAVWGLEQPDLPINQPGMFKGLEQKVMDLQRMGSSAAMAFLVPGQEEEDLAGTLEAQETPGDAAQILLETVTAQANLR